MQQAADLLRRGEDSTTEQDKALDRIDDAQNRLNDTQEARQEELQREQERQVVNQLKALRDRQARAMEEMKRLHSGALARSAWDRGLRVSLHDLQKEQAKIADEIQKERENQYSEVPVFKRMLRQATDALELVDRRLALRLDLAELGPFEKETEEIAQAGITYQQELVHKRLDQLVNALQDKIDKKDAQAKKDPQQPPDKENNPPKQGQQAGNKFPPMAELKALRELQADIAVRTEKFHQQHPKNLDLNDDELLELELLEKMQRDVSELVREAIKKTETEDVPMVP
jgi:hypothetical protein